MCILSVNTIDKYQILVPNALPRKKEKLAKINKDACNTSETKLLSCPSTGAVQSYIGCLCQNTREAVVTAAPSNTSSHSAATTTSGRGRPAALSNHWLPHHSPTRPTELSAWGAQWGRPCQLKDWKEVQSFHAVSAVMADPWTLRGWSPWAFKFKWLVSVLKEN